MAAAAESAQAAAAASSTAAAAAAAAAAKDPKVRRASKAKRLRGTFGGRKGRSTTTSLTFPKYAQAERGRGELDINIPDDGLFLHTGSTLYYSTHRPPPLIMFTRRPHNFSPLSGLSSTSLFCRSLRYFFVYAPPVCFGASVSK